MRKKPGCADSKGGERKQSLKPTSLTHRGPLWDLLKGGIIPETKAPWGRNKGSPASALPPIKTQVRGLPWWRSG